MTLSAVLAWTVARGVVVSLLAVPMSGAMWRLARIGQRRLFCRVLPLLALMPLFVPDLLTGFTYRLTSARLVHSVAATEMLYGLLLLFRVTALQLLLRLILPSSSVSRESVYSWKLIHQASSTFRGWNWWFGYLRLLISGPCRSATVSWMAGVLLCFQEFETAALLQIDRHPAAWAVWLFDAHAAGEPLVRSLQLAASGLLLQSLLLLPAIVLVRLGRQASVSTLGQGRWSSAGQAGGARRMRCFDIGVAALICGGLVLTIVWPVASHGMAVIQGLRVLIGQGGLGARLWQIVMSALNAGLAAASALLVMQWLYHRSSSWITAVIVVPGLSGALVLSLMLLALFQWPVLQGLYDSWLPLLLGQTLWLLPRALLLVAVLCVLAPPTSVHAAHLLKAARCDSVRQQAWQLIWRLQGVRWLMSAGILTHWCLWDVTVVSILRPVQFEPIVSRLYNEMHFGRTESLVAVTALALTVPLGMLWAVAILWKRGLTSGRL